MKTISIVSQKGGTGKTTTAFHLLWNQHYTVAMDFDPQCQLTGFLSNDDFVMEKSGFAMLQSSNPDPSEYLCRFDDRLNFIPASFGGFDTDLQIHENDRKKILESFVENIHNLDTDYLIIDCGPAQFTPTIAAILAADLILIPVECAQSNVSPLNDIIGLLHTYDIDTPILILPTKYNRRRKTDQQFLRDLIRIYGEDRVLKQIPDSAKIKSIFSTHKPYMKINSFGEGYQNLIERIF